MPARHEPTCSSEGRVAILGALSAPSQPTSSMLMRRESSSRQSLATIAFTREKPSQWGDARSAGYPISTSTFSCFSFVVASFVVASFIVASSSVASSSVATVVSSCEEEAGGGRTMRRER